jgi:hypothetical protein
MNLRTDSGQKTFKAKKGRFECFVFFVVSLSSPFCVFLPLCLMAAARGAKYLEEARLRQQEGQRVRTEARIVQLKLTAIETRIADLERWKGEFERKSTARTLSFGSIFLYTTSLLLLFLLLSFYVFTSSLRPPTLDQNEKARE